VLWRESSAHVDANAGGHGLRRGFEEIVIRHGRDSSRIASGSRRDEGAARRHWSARYARGPMEVNRTLP
jgi:hypothetical protein